MKSRQICIWMVMLTATWQSAMAQPKNKTLQADVPGSESILAGTNLQSSPVVSELMANKPEMPLGPKDVLKSYEVAMSLVAEKMSSDFSGIVQAQQANQISREQAEYLLQQRYQIAMMEYQVLSALHDVLKHDINEAAGQQAKRSLKVTDSDVVVVPFPDSGAGYR